MTKEATTNEKLTELKSRLSESLLQGDRIACQTIIDESIRLNVRTGQIYNDLIGPVPTTIEGPKLDPGDSKIASKRPLRPKRVRTILGWPGGSWASPGALVGLSGTALDAAWVAFGVPGGAPGMVL